MAASVNRPDVAALYPGYGPLHGFDVSLALPVGVHLVCAYGNNVVGGVTNTALGCVNASGSGPAGSFQALSPVRLLDSRNGTGGYTTPWTAGQTRSLHVAGVGGVPADATAVVLNVTATDVSTASYVTATPSGGVIPTASNLNVTAGQTIANLVTVQVGAGGSVDLYNAHGQVDLVADVVGYYVTAPGDGFTAAQPGTPPRLPQRHRRLHHALEREPDPGPDGGGGGRGARRRRCRGAQPDRDQPHRGQLRHRLARRLGPAHRLQHQLHRRPDHRQPGHRPRRRRRRHRPVQPVRPHRPGGRRGRLLHRPGRGPVRGAGSHPGPRLPDRHRRLHHALGTRARPGASPSTASARCPPTPPRWCST